MLGQERKDKLTDVGKDQQKLASEETHKAIELTPREISFMMQFGNYYPGFSPEWELFR